MHETFFGATSQLYGIERVIENVVDFLAEQGMVERNGDSIRILGVGGAGRLDDFRFAVDLGLEEGAFEANLLDAAGSEDAPGVHFVEFVLDGGAAAVDY